MITPTQALALAAITVSLTGCAMPTAAQRDATNAAAVVQAARAQQTACMQQVKGRPDLAVPVSHLLPGVAGQFSMAQMTNQNVPSAAEAASVSALYDALSACNGPYREAVRSVRPDVAEVLDQAHDADAQVAIQLVERRITWGEAVRRVSHVASEVKAQIAEANGQWVAEKNAENQAELNRRQAAAAAYLNYSAQMQMVNAMNHPTYVAPAAPVHCTSLMTGPLVSTNCH